MKQTRIVPKRGDVYLVNFNPSIGSEIKKTRPAVILQNNISNTYSPTTIVAAITSHTKEKKIYPTEVYIPAHEARLEKDSRILLNQVQTIDTKRLIKKLGTVETQTLEKIDNALTISLGLIDI